MINTDGIEPKEKNLENIFQNLFEQTSGTGEEELLRIASTYSRQMTAYQIKGLMLLRFCARWSPEYVREALDDYVANWLEFKQWNNSALFVMKALEFISLKKFLGENAIKVNVEK